MIRGNTVTLADNIFTMAKQAAKNNLIAEQKRQEAANLVVLRLTAPTARALRNLIENTEHPLDFATAQELLNQLPAAPK